MTINFIGDSIPFARAPASANTLGKRPRGVPLGALNRAMGRLDTPRATNRTTQTQLTGPVRLAGGTTDQLVMGLLF
jgi:hypothetical protein